MSDQNQQPKQFVSFDDESVQLGNGIVFKAEKESVTRVYFPEPKNIFMYSQHFDGKDDGNNAGFIRCMADAGKPCLACQYHKPPIRRFKTNMIIEATGTTDGSVPNAMFVVLSHRVFRFGDKSFGTLRAKDNKFKSQGGLAAVDLTLKCTNDAYQHFDIDDAGLCIIFTDERLKAMYEVIKKQFVDFTKDRDARFPTDLEMRNWVAKATGAAVVSTGTPFNPAGNDMLRNQLPPAQQVQQPRSAQELPPADLNDVSDFVQQQLATQHFPVAGAIPPAIEAPAPAIPPSVTSKLMDV